MMRLETRQYPHLASSYRYRKDKERRKEQPGHDTARILLSTLLYRRMNSSRTTHDKIKISASHHVYGSPFLSSLNIFSEISI